MVRYYPGNRRARDDDCAVRCWFPTAGGGLVVCAAAAAVVRGFKKKKLESVGAAPAAVSSQEVGLG
jgi:hypothetical protein